MDCIGAGLCFSCLHVCGLAGLPPFARDPARPNGCKAFPARGPALPPEAWPPVPLPAEPRFPRIPLPGPERPIVPF
jgi:hypothetical protein